MVLIAISIILSWWSMLVTPSIDGNIILLRLNPINPIFANSEEMAILFSYFSGPMGPMIGVILSVFFWILLLAVILGSIFTTFDKIGWGTAGLALAPCILFLILVSILSTTSGFSWFGGEVTEVIDSTTYTFAWHLDWGFLCALAGALILCMVRISYYFTKK
jgi:hypothetical protein